MLSRFLSAAIPGFRVTVRHGSTPQVCASSRRGIATPLENASFPFHSSLNASAFFSTATGVAPAADESSDTKDGPRRKTSPDASQPTTPSKASKSRKLRKKKKKQKAGLWHGLTYKKNRKNRPHAPKLLDLQASATDTAFRVTLHGPSQPIAAAMGIFHAARAHSTSSSVFLPSQHSVATLIDVVLSEAERHLHVYHLSAHGADLATEAIFRCMDAFQLSPTLPPLVAVIRAAARDPIVERRAPRALSVLRFAQGLRLVLDARMIHECFRACVAGLDVEAAATLMEYALKARMYAEERGETSGAARVIDLYDGVMFASLLMGDLNTTATALTELTARGISPTLLTESVALALSLEQDDTVAAQTRHSMLVERGVAVHDCAFAAMVRAAGRVRDVAAVRKAFRAYEVQRGLARGNFARLVHAREVMFPGVNGAASARAAAAARADPVVAMFEALRVCGEGGEAMAFLRYLQRVYGFRASKGIYVLVIETCWREGELDLARGLRKEMEGAMAKENGVRDKVLEGAEWGGWEGLKERPEGNEPTC